MWPVLTKVTAGQRESGVMEFLQSICNTLHDAQGVWPAKPDQICGEVTASYNYILVKIISLVCDYKLVSSSFDESKTNDVITTILRRAYKGITDSEMEESCNGNVTHVMLKIVKVLENPVFHFKSLTILGRLLLLMTVVCLYKRRIYGSSQEDVTCLLRFTEMAGVPVLKESCHFHHGLLLSYPSSEDIQEEVKTVMVEHVVCLFLATFKQPINQLVMDHQPWKWIFTAMECRNLMEQRMYTLAMQKLQVVLKQCVDSINKCRLLCLFAHCYFHMDCPQLSIQTYRDALQADSRCYSILYHLSLVYQSLDLPELELESLNLCVMALADEEKRQKDKIPVLGVDELIWSIIPPITPVSFILAKVTFAKRCLQLKRYPEAAEQYSSLISLLQEENAISQFENHETDKELNIAEILVEAAEVLLITRQYQDCIKLCANTQPALSADDTFAQNSYGITNSTENISTENSQSDFFSLLDNSQSMESLDPLSSPKGKLKCQTDNKDSSVNLSVSFEKSRKRMRSCDAMDGVDVDDAMSESRDDILNVRLLLCRADALVLSQGFTDNAVYCLQKAMDLLVCHPPPSTIKSDLLGQGLSLMNPPHSKRQRISSDGKSVCPQQAKNYETCLSAGTSNNDVWSRLLIDTALRMAKASWKRRRFSSVINSCRVVEQLDGGNMGATYIKTQMMSENGGLQREAIGVWLNSRGIAYLVDKKELEKSIKRIQETPEPTEKSNMNWWNVSEGDFLTMDVKCLKLLLNICDVSNK